MKQIEKVHALLCNLCAQLFICVFSCKILGVPILKLYSLMWSQSFCVCVCVCVHMVAGALYNKPNHLTPGNVTWNGGCHSDLIVLIMRSHWYGSTCQHCLPLRCCTINTPQKMVQVCVSFSVQPKIKTSCHHLLTLMSFQNLYDFHSVEHKRRCSEECLFPNSQVKV